MMRTSVCALVIFVAFSAQAQPPNAAAVLKACALDQNAPSTVCTAYMNGFLAGILADQVSRQQGRSICLPSVAKTNDAIVAVVAFIAAHREFWAKDGASVVGVALQQAYPCH